MLVQGYSAKKILQMLPDEIKVSLNTIYRIDKVATYEEYRGVRQETDSPDKVTIITPHSQTKEIVEAINKTNILLESLFTIVKELNDSLR